MAQFLNIFKVDLNQGAAPVAQLRQIHYGDVSANRIGADVYLNGEPVTLGGTCSGTAILANGGTVALTGTVSENRAYVDLPSACYAVEGPIQVFVKLTASGVTTTLVSAVGTVRLTETGTVIDPGTVIDSVSELIEDIETAVSSIPSDYSSLLASIAPTFSASDAYTAGRLVWYSGSLYRFNKDHAAGSWTGSDAETVVMASDLGRTETAFIQYTGGTTAFSIADFEKGSVSTGGVNSTYRQNARARTKGWVLSLFDANVTCDADIQFYVYFADGTHSGAWITNEGSYVIPSGAVYRICIRMPNADGASDVNALTDLVGGMRIASALNKSEKFSYIPVGAFDQSLFEKGGIGGTTGQDTDFAAAARMRSVFLLATEPLSVYIDKTDYANACVRLFTYTADGTLASAGDWAQEVSVPKGAYFRIAATLDSTSTTSAYTVSQIFAEMLFGNAKESLVEVIAHQGNVSKDNNNSKLEGYLLAGKCGYSGAECDIKRTSDNQFVCCHDASFTDATTQETVTINEHTLAELKTYNYYGGTIASLEEVVIACKQAGLKLYIDQYAAWNADRYAEIAAILKKHKMEDKTWHIVYDSTAASRILTALPKAHMIFSQSQSSADASAALALANAYADQCGSVTICLWKGLGENVIGNACETMPPYYGVNIYRPDSAEDKRTMAKYATSITTNGSSSLYPEG